MISYEHACEVAMDSLAKIGLTIIKSAYETEELWIFFGATPEGPLPMSSAVSVDKSDGAIQDFYLPDDKNFEILDSAKQIDLH